MKEINMKQLVEKHFPETKTVQLPIFYPPSAHPVRTKKSKLKDFCKFISPFILLVVFIFIFSGIYYAVEHQCQINFYCPHVDVHVVLYLDNITDNDTLWFENQAKHNFSHEMATTDYWEAIHFIVVSVTTIGYGDIVPCSWQGQLVSIVSCIMGIPITLIGLARLGQLFAIVLHKLWTYVYKRFRKPPYKDVRLMQLSDPRYVPLSLGLIVTFCWILICSAYFYSTLKSEYENKTKFTFFTSFYFTMITFMTIGYGEFAPVQYKMIFPNLVLILIGLSLVGLCIRLFQSEIENVVNDLVDMIDKEYTETLDDDDKTMSDDKKHAVKSLINEKQKQSDLVTKVVVASMGKSTQKRLQNIYEDKAKKVFSVYVQAKPDLQHLQVQQSSKNGFSVKSIFFEIDEECQVNFDDDNCYEKCSSLSDEDQTTLEDIMEFN